LVKDPKAPAATLSLTVKGDVVDLLNLRAFSKISHAFSDPTRPGPGDADHHVIIRHQAPLFSSKRLIMPVAVGASGRNIGQPGFCLRTNFTFKNRK
jgi:hypothetical protein